MKKAIIISLIALLGMFILISKSFAQFSNELNLAVSENFELQMENNSSNFAEYQNDDEDDDGDEDEDDYEDDDE